jgi:RNA polymerase sigma-70 factor (ECF subfamily)
MAANEKSQEGQDAQRTMGNLLESSLDSLPQVYRTVLILRDMDGLSTAETADCLDLDQKLVETYLLRAHEMLSRRLFDRIVHEATDVFQFLDTRCDRVVKNVFDRIKG